MAQGSISGTGLFGNAAQTVTLTPGALFEMRTGPTDRAVITEIGVNLIGANRGYAVGLGVPVAQGVNPALGVGGAAAAFDVNNAASPIYVATQWNGAPPTAPATFKRRESSSMAAAGAAVPFVFRFPRGLTLAGSSSLVAWLIAVSGTAYLSFEYYIEFDA